MLTQLPIRLGIVLSASRTPLRHVSMSADLVDAKKTMRKAMKAELKGLDAATITTASERACERLLALEAFERSVCVSVYLSMPAECQTHKLLEAAFARGKRVFVPKITGSGREDMRMVHVESLEQLRAFPCNSWGIPEPPMAMVDASAPPPDEIDLVVVPGVAFDGACRRLGHGKGYYDTFDGLAARAGARAAAAGGGRPRLQVQLVPSVPVDARLRPDAICLPRRAPLASRVSERGCRSHTLVMAFATA